MILLQTNSISVSSLLGVLLTIDVTCRKYQMSNFSCWGFFFPIFFFLLAEELHVARVLSISSFVERNDPTTESFSRLSSERSIMRLYNWIISLFSKVGGIRIYTRQGISNPTCTSGKIYWFVEYNLIKTVAPLSSRNFVALEISIGKWTTVTLVFFIQIFLAKKSNGLPSSCWQYNLSCSWGCQYFRW